MARKKAEIQLQVEVETQEEWEEMLAKEGLTVVDVYQEWCGPCKAMVSVFRRIKNEIGDDLLRFAIAKADTVDSLEKYRGRCQPRFLFFAGGVLVSFIEGAMCPAVTKTITEQLAQEHRVLEGSAERKEVKDPRLSASDDKEQGADDDDEDEEGEDEDVLKQVSGHRLEDVDPNLLPKSRQSSAKAKKAVTVAIIKPDLVQAGKQDEVMEKMKEYGIEILEQTEKQLTEEEAREFYAHKSEEPFFEDLVKHMTSGPSIVLVLTKGETGETIIEEWRELLGPASVEDAKEQAPDSLRAQYGTETYVNALHGSDTNDTAMKELAFFFPSFNVPTVPRAEKPAKAGAAPPPSPPRVQRTLALIRPDALKEKKDEILEKIKEAGFQVAMQKEMQLTKEQAADFYKEHKDQEYFEELTNRMSSGPLLALALCRDDAVTAWRDVLGPKEVDKAKEEAPQSLRAQFSVEEVPINQLHGTDEEEKVQKEMEFFFGPMEQTVAVIKPDAYQTKDDIIEKIKEAGFHVAARQETELTKEVAEHFYADHKEKEYFGDLVDHMASGPTLFMVLSREDAVNGWRSMLGPVDPSVAKEEAPDSLRAQFGQDIKANAVHGPSDKEHADATMKLMFGEMEFTEDAQPVPEQAPAEEGQQKQEEGEAPPAAEGAPAAEGEAPAAEGEQQTQEAAAPAEEAKTEEEQKEEPPKEEEQKAEEPVGEEKPAEEAAPPAAEEQKPAEGEAAEQAPAEGEEKKEGEEEKKEGEEQTKAE